MLLLGSNFSPICVKDSIHTTTIQEKQVGTVECKIHNTRKLGKIMDHFIHLRRKKYKQEGTCIRPKVYAK